MPPRLERRNALAHSAILDAAWELAKEVGYARLTVEGIAKRAGVGKQTIYRWWTSKDAVLLEVLDARTTGTLDFPDTGDLRADLSHQVRQAAKFLGSAEYAPFRGLIGAAQSDPDLANWIRTAILAPRIDACIARLKSGQAAGQLRADVDPRDVVEMIYGPIYYRLLLQTRKVRPADAARQLQLLLDGLSP